MAAFPSQAEGKTTTPNIYDGLRFSCVVRLSRKNAYETRMFIYRYVKKYVKIRITYQIVELFLNHFVYL